MAQPPGPSPTLEDLETRERALASPAFGVKYDRFRSEFGDSESYLRSLPRGVTWYEVEWCAIEPRPGDRDWTVVDDAVDETERLRWALVLKIRTGSCWATGGAAGEPQGRRRMTPSLFPEDLDDYREFVQSVVRRYAARGVHGWAIENEVNALNFWRASPKAYEELARTASAAIREADPEAVVYDGGISSAGYGSAIARMLLARGEDERAVEAYNRYYERRFSTRARDYRRVGGVDELRAELERDRSRLNLSFVDATFRLAREGVFDVFQLHFYERWDNVPELLRLLDSSLPEQMPIEALEVGFYNPDDKYDHDAHAAELARTISLLLEGGVQRVVLLPLAHNPDGREQEEIRWGLLDPQTGAPRTAAEVFASLASAGEGGRLYPITQNGVDGIVLGDDGHATLVAWSRNGRAILSSNAPVSGTRVDGEPVDTRGDRIELDEVPVVVSAAVAAADLVPRS